MTCPSERKVRAFFRVVSPFAQALSASSPIPLQGILSSLLVKHSPKPLLLQCYLSETPSKMKPPSPRPNPHLPIKMLGMAKACLSHIRVTSVSYLEYTKLGSHALDNLRHL